MTRTNGNVIVEEIKVGDIHYEYDMGLGFKCEVLTKPQLNENGKRYVSCFFNGLKEIKYENKGN